jgi:hypothetical protein
MVANLGGDRSHQFKDCGAVCEAAHVLNSLLNHRLLRRWQVAEARPFALTRQQARHGSRVLTGRRLGPGGCRPFSETGGAAHRSVGCSGREPRAGRARVGESSARWVARGPTAMRVPGRRFHPEPAAARLPEPAVPVRRRAAGRDQNAVSSAGAEQSRSEMYADSLGGSRSSRRRARLAWAVAWWKDTAWVMAGHADVVAVAPLASLAASTGSSRANNRATWSSVAVCHPFPDRL